MLLLVRPWCIVRRAEQVTIPVLLYGQAAITMTALCNSLIPCCKENDGLPAYSQLKRRYRGLGPAAVHCLCLPAPCIFGRSSHYLARSPGFA
ncbi:hypothetical protein BC567DRAFT_237905 [Phyllosticta citribraziliensis]